MAGRAAERSELHELNLRLETYIRRQTDAAAKEKERQERAAEDLQRQRAEKKAIEEKLSPSDHRQIPQLREALRSVPRAVAFAAIEVRSGCRLVWSAVFSTVEHAIRRSSCSARSLR